MTERSEDENVAVRSNMPLFRCDGVAGRQMPRRSGCDIAIDGLTRRKEKAPMVCTKQKDRKPKSFPSRPVLWCEQRQYTAPDLLCDRLTGPCRRVHVSRSSKSNRCSMTTTERNDTQHGPEDFADFPWDRLNEEWINHFSGQVGRRNFAEDNPGHPKFHHYISFYDHDELLSRHDWAIPEPLAKLIETAYKRGSEHRAREIRAALGVKG